MQRFPKRLMSLVVVVVYMQDTDSNILQKLCAISGIPSLRITGSGVNAIA